MRLLRRLPDLPEQLSSVIVKLNDDGGVSLITGAVDMGQGAETVLSQIVAEEMSVPMEDIQVYAADTETTTVDIGSWISGLTWSRETRRSRPQRTR